jgi:hypothetical protein
VTEGIFAIKSNIIFPQFKFYQGQFLVIIRQKPLKMRILHFCFFIVSSFLFHKSTLADHQSVEDWCQLDNEDPAGMRFLVPMLSNLFLHP